MRSFQTVRVIGLLILALTFFCQPEPPTAFACSGGPPKTTLDTVLEEADYLVRGTIIALDDALKNALLLAEEYVIGDSGPAYLLLDRVSPVLSSVYVGHGYDTGCLYGGASALPLGMTAYWAVARQPNGSYSVIGNTQSPFFDLAWLSTDDELGSITVRIDPQGEDEWENVRSVDFKDEADFRQYIREASGVTPAVPQLGELPLMRPLLITYDDGTHQMYPVDGGDLVPVDEAPTFEAWSAYDYPNLLETPLYCAEAGCRLTSADQSVYALQKTPDLIEFSPYYVDKPLQTLSGQAFQFSPNGEAFLIWNEGVMQVYMLQDALCDCLDFGGLNPVLGLTIEIPFSLADFTTARWSIDGTTFAYADSIGIWLLDVFRQTEPELLISSNSTLYPLSLFTSGRFVAYSTGHAGSWEVLDRMTGSTFGQALFSPDERYIVYVDDPASYPELDSPVCALPVSQQCFGVFSPAELQSLTWTDGSQGWAVSCAPEGCHLNAVPTLAQPPFTELIHTRQFPPVQVNRRVSDTTYDHLYGVYALVLDNYEIVLYRDTRASGTGGGNDTVRRRLQLDPNSVVSIAWMESLFFTESE